jgi:FtsZ-binding cell division protein ZapB
MMGLGCLSLGLIQRANSRSATTPREPAAASAAKDPQELQRQLDTLEQKTAALAQQRDSLKDKLDAISQQAAHNQLLLSLLLGFAGLFTLAQGVFAFFSAQSYVKQADDALARIETLADEVRRKYPMFSQIEDAREAAFGRLARLADRLNLDQNLYQESDPITRQEILALESFAATQFLASPGREKEVIANLRLLGKF